MKAPKNIYRKNFTLLTVFLVLITVSFVIAVIISYNLTAKYVENEFSSKKVEVLDQTSKPYNDFFQLKIPEITSYQGFLDSASAANYSATVFKTYPFVRRILFYDLQIGNKPTNVHFTNGRGISVKAIYQYKLKGNAVRGLKDMAFANQEDFKRMAYKLSNFISVADTTKLPTQDEIFRTFYDVSPDKISYLNIPRREDVKIYQSLLRNSAGKTFYKQNMMTFLLDAHFLRVKNTHPELYQQVSIEPVVYDPLDVDGSRKVTEAALTGAFSNYKLYFTSSNEHLKKEIDRRFLPIGAIVMLVYLFMILIIWLIYRNLNVNLKIFKLQYDFINNFTHEFKTPVSVIKIAGSNLRGDAELSERQRKHYGKILDEEADKLNDLMNRLLSFTQLENRSININKENVALRDFVQGYVNTFKIKYPDFALSHTIASGVNEFNTDPVLLGSVFQNLMENAYKYSHPGRKELHIDIRPEKRNLVFKFADKGIGIARPEVGDVFKKFYRIENQYNQNGSVGLGLAFCKELVNFMGGEITVTSKVKEGSTFTVILPFDN
ncbi:sensor histidine kinase [Mucilaginibacter sp.]|uniref:sensor histidine kinase n=1 Tax=Mucilaginibacter sp. TaxID=1882438 RepID=UPI000CBAD824|nr:HAMP domain-containing sensor histidine kinase [Mucilaginibacter sp.]PLW90533.1 MAG: sensor histidine kinase [Mucilaginibacter sp.]PMP66256.1 MAG: sensor histidine kinase [Mucilaginibacter sp.]HEK22163.1 HAMP domain-containing histidine kinase [Bacteroidota bacterium]